MARLRPHRYPNARSALLCVIAGFTLSLLACVSAPPPVDQLPDEKEFAVPTKLADQFTVKAESGIPVEPPPSVPEAKPKRGIKKVAKEKKKVAAPPKPFQWPDRWKIPPFFQPGERYRFDITFFGATAGGLVLELLPMKVLNERPVFHIRAIATTASVFSLIYRLNDVADSYMDATGLFSHKFSLKLDESLQQRDVLELYDQRKHMAYYWSRLDHKKKGKQEDQKEIPIEPFTQDGISAFYYLRTLPLEPGEVYEFPVLTNAKVRTVRVTVVRRESIKTKIGEIPAIVLKPEVVLDGVLKTYGDSFVWISDDPRRILLKVDAKIKVGSIIAYLREHTYGQPPSANP